METRKTSPTDKVLDLSAEEKELDELCKSIERSRKRNLSPVVQRGDLVVDKLREQEASASPLFKKARNSLNAMSMTFADFESYMDRKVNKRLDRLDSVDEGVTELRSLVSGVTQKVAANTDKLISHDKSIEENRASIAAIKRDVDRLSNAQLPATQAWHRDPNPNSDPAAQPDFLKARRSIRLWPVIGSTKIEIWRATGNFLKERLAIDSQEIKDEMIESIVRVQRPSGPSTTNKVLVVFKENAPRDQVLGKSGKLAECIDKDGKPTAGIRLEIPAYLQTDFRILFRYGQILRTRHGQGTRRHVKFDDVEGTIYLNVKLPGDTTWSSVTTEMARKGLRKRARANDDDLERRLDIDEEPKQRSASVSDAIRPTAQPTTPRRGASVSS